MAIKDIHHLNYIGHEINESLNLQFPPSDREVYCKRLHKITEPTNDDCSNCPYFAGFMMGYGHDCYWKDVSPVEDEEMVIAHDDIQKEFMRVSQLIDAGYVQKG